MNASACREPVALQCLRRDAQDMEGLQHELELHTTIISPAFLEELQGLWRNVSAFCASQ